MKAWEFVWKLCSTSTGKINFHVYNKETKQSEDIHMGVGEAICRVQAGSRTVRSEYPFAARVETIVLTNGGVELNCSI